MVNMREIPNDCESVEFSSLPLRIRALIRHLWESNPDIYTPSGSTSDHNDAHDQIGQASLADQRAPDDTEYRESLEAETRTQNQAECESDNSADNERQNQLISSLLEQAPEETVAAPGTSEELRNRKDRGEAIAYENQPNGMEMVAYEDVADEDFDSSRTIGDRLAELRGERRRRHEENVNKAAKDKPNPKKKQKVSKLPTHRLISDVLKELKDQYLETPDEYVEIPSPNNKNKNKKRRKPCKTNESPRFDEAGPSSQGVASHTGGTEPCGSGSVSGRLSMAEPSNQGPRTRSSRPSGSCQAMGRVERANSLQCGPNRLNSDIDINDPLVNEAVAGLFSLKEMTQTRECNGLGECDGCEPSGSLSEVVPASVVNGSRAETEMETIMEAEMETIMETEMETETEMEIETVQAEGLDSENVACTLNQNPAEFSTEDAKIFLREE